MLSSRHSLLISLRSDLVLRNVSIQSQYLLKGSVRVPSHELSLDDDAAI